MEFKTGNMLKLKERKRECRSDLHSALLHRQELSDVAEEIIQNCDDRDCFVHADFEPIPSVESVVEIINRLKEIVFPGYFSGGRLNPVNLKYIMGQSVSVVFDMLSEQISNSIRHDCIRYDQPCHECQEKGQQAALELLRSIPSIRRSLSKDVRATFDGDPAARSYDEIIFSYPGIQAITVYRIAHQLFELNVPILPRTMSEFAHSVTGIDIHPGAEIGESFVIDHGTGIVIGETTVIGNNVRIYQGVTLGAHSLPPNAGSRLKGVQRHPTIKDDVIIYAGTTILGGATIIGERSVIGGNVWLTESIPADTKVIMKTPELIYN